MMGRGKPDVGHMHTCTGQAETHGGRFNGRNCLPV
jgi:hypothetical protein